MRVACSTIWTEEEYLKVIGGKIKGKETSWEIKTWEGG
jgi:hypothetical protein